jgi:hypothetical protein
MSNSISTLLTRNLQDVFGENDPARRRAAINEIFTEDCVFYDSNGGIYNGRDEIDRIAGVIRGTHPDFRYQPILTCWFVARPTLTSLAPRPRTRRFPDTTSTPF